jgi:ribosomal protein S12 methylthiotransferase
MEPAPPKASVFFRSLGCPKNQVDSEVMLGSLVLEGYAVAERIEDADVAVVNTCAFIESAREESIEAILEVSDLRDSGALRALVVTGCLPQRYSRELARELPEVDAFIGTGEFPKIARVLDDALAGRSRGVYVDAGRTHLYDESEPRLLIGPRHSAYVKIAEGCDRVCAFCAIPGIRGRHQSRAPESLLAEAEQLAREGVREINLVSQDTLSWGKDLPGRPRLASLLRELDRVEGLDWIRLLYLYPTALTDELLDVLANGRRLLPYIDVPLQHASDRLLRAMRRGVTAERQRQLVERIRKRVPDATLRTTFIVGFPGETAQDFAQLCDFVREARFDRAGVFRYSDEEGTAAHGYSEKVPRRVARERHRRLVELQQGIMQEKLEAQVGDIADVLIDRSATGISIGRLASQAPEIDGVVHLREAAPVGELVRARITAVRHSDLEAERLPRAAAASG